MKSEKEGILTNRYPIRLCTRRSTYLLVDMKVVVYSRHGLERKHFASSYYPINA